MTKIVEFVTVGDPHLDKLKNLFPNNHLDLQIAELEKPFIWALKNGVENVVVLGDIGDKERLSEEAQIALLTMLFKYDGKLNVWVILGNHDVKDNGTHSLQLFVKIYKEKKFKTTHIVDKPIQVVMNGMAFNFLPFPCIKALPYKNHQTVNFAHLERPGAVRDNGLRIKKEHGTKADKNIWVVGHLHTPQILDLTWFGGTLYQQNFGESFPKGFLYCKFKENGKSITPKIKFIKNDPAFKFHNLVVEKLSDLKQISNNQLYKYKIFVKKGVELPDNLHNKYPNIINTPIRVKNKKEVAVLVSDEQSNFTLTSNLTSYLKKKHGAKKKQIKRAKQLLAREAKKLGITLP